MSTTSQIIQLTRDRIACVDAADGDLVARYSWHAIQDAAGRWYAKASIAGRDGKRREVYLHRFILGAPPKTHVRFLDGDTLNCTRANLTFGMHAATLSGGGRSRFKGVSYVNGPKGGQKPWRAELRFAGKLHWIGQFVTEEEAADAYDATLIELGGNPALTNRAILARLAASTARSTSEEAR